MRSFNEQLIEDRDLKADRFMAEAFFETTFRLKFLRLMAK